MSVVTESKAEREESLVTWHLRLPRRLADEVAVLAEAERRGVLQQAIVLLELAVRQTRARGRRASDNVRRVS